MKNIKFTDWQPGVKYVVKASSLAFDNMDNILHKDESNILMMPMMWKYNV